MLLDESLIAALLGAQQVLQRLLGLLPVFALGQGLDFFRHALRGPGEADHGRVDSVAVRSSLEPAGVHLQGAQGFDDPRLEPPQSGRNVARLGDVAAAPACRALALGDCWLGHPLEVYGLQLPRAQAAAAGADAPRSFLAPGFHHLGCGVLGRRQRCVVEANLALQSQRGNRRLLFCLLRCARPLQQLLGVEDLAPRQPLVLLHGVLVSSALLSAQALSCKPPPCQAICPAAAWLWLPLLPLGRAAPLRELLGRGLVSEELDASQRLAEDVLVGGFQLLQRLSDFAGKACSLSALQNMQCLSPRLGCVPAGCPGSIGLKMQGSPL